MKGIWQTTNSGGSGLGVVVLVIVAAALLGPAVGAAAVAAAVAELVHIVLITVTVLLGLGAAGLVAYAALRVHRWRTGTPPRVPLPAPPPWRAVQSAREPRQVTSTRPPAIGRGGQLHLHFHGVGADDVAAIIARQQEDQP